MGDLAVVDDPRLALHLLEPVEALRDDVRRLAHLVHRHLVAVVHVVAGRRAPGNRPGRTPVRLGLQEVQSTPTPAGPARTGRARARPLPSRPSPSALEADLVRGHVGSRPRRTPGASTPRLKAPGKKPHGDVLGEAAHLEVPLCMRVPATNSERLRIHARSRKQYQNIESSPRPRLRHRTRGASGSGSVRREACASTTPSAGPRVRAASRSRGRTRARCSGTRRSRSARGT